MRTSASSQTLAMQTVPESVRIDSVEEGNLTGSQAGTGAADAATWYDSPQESAAAEDWENGADGELLADSEIVAPEEALTPGDDHIPELSSDEMMAGDLMSMYVRDVAAHPLLSVDEEKRLTQELLRHRLALVVLLGGHPLSLAALMAFVSSDSDFFSRNTEWRDWALRNGEVETALMGLFRDHAKTLPRLIPRELLADMKALHQQVEEASAAGDRKKTSLAYRALMRHLVGVQFPHELILSLCQVLTDTIPMKRRRAPLNTLVPLKPARLLHKIERRLAKLNVTKRKLVQANLRLVVFIAQKHRYGGVQLHDLVQEGNLGLLKAADKFDYRKGFRFATYAYWWIQQQIKLAIKRQSDLIPSPVYVQDEISKFNIWSVRLQQEAGREVSVSEVAKHMDVSVERGAMLAMGAQRVLSMERAVSSESDTNLGDLLPDQKVESPSWDYLKHQREQAVQNLLEHLSPREARVMALRFGVGIHQEYTLREVASQIGVSPERVRQIEREALAKLQDVAGGSLRSLLADD